MNLFPEEPKINKDALYYKDLAANKMKQFNDFVKIRVEVRKLIKDIPEGARMKLCKEILEVERSSDKEVRNKYYKNIKKRWEELLFLVNPKV